MRAPHRAAGVLLCVAAAFWGRAATLQAQQTASPSTQPPTSQQQIRITGAREVAEPELLEAARAGLEKGADEAVAAVLGLYRQRGYSYARATADVSAESGLVTISVDEGHIDEVEFVGVEPSLARSFARDFALRGGDVFNAERAAEALEALLRPTRGALRPSRPDAPRRGVSTTERAFDLVQRNGRRVLLIGLRDRPGTFRLNPTLGNREDWFTAVDGLVPAVSLGAAVFEHRRFNHAYLAAHLSYKTAAQRVGYAVGFERPLFDTPKLYVGAEVHDLTATDDTWQVTNFEAGLAAIVPAESYRDYYRRRGGQVHAAVRVRNDLEVIVMWRGERHRALRTETGFNLWDRDEEFRPNRPATPGQLKALVFGAAYSSAGFATEPLAATYRRHQADTFYGSPIAGARDTDGGLWRIDWTSEIAGRGELGGDFAFNRHIVHGRGRLPLSRHEEVALRVLHGWASGSLPVQRRFAAGGIGSVHGYRFKEAIGDQLTQLNAEYALGALRGVHVIPFFDAARVRTLGGDVTWLKGTGIGLGFTRDIRLDFGYRVDDIPGSFQLMFRVDRTF